MNHWKCKLFVAAICVAAGPLVRGQSAPADAPRSGPTPATTPAPADRAYLGVYIGSENDGGGVKLDQVVDGSPAAKAGLQTGDVITALGDRTIGNEEELRDAIGSHQAGEKVKVTFLRDGEKRRTSARLGKAPAEVEGAAGAEQAAPAIAEKQSKRAESQAAPKPRTKMVEVGPAAGAGSGGDGGPAFMGVMLGQDDEGRTTISQVVEGSPAEKAGLKEGDVVLSIDAADAGSADDVVKLVQSHHAGDKVTVVVERNGAKQKVNVKLGQKSAEASGVGGIAVPSPLPPPATAKAAPAPAKSVKARGRIAAPANPEAASSDPMRKEFDALRAELEKTRREMEDLRRKCETQQRTIDAIRHALGGGEPGSTSTSASASSPGGDATAMISIPVASGSMGTSEISFAAPEATIVAAATPAAPAECSASGDDSCCAASGEGEAVAQFVVDGDGGAFVVTDGDGDGHTVVLQLDDDAVKQFHGRALGGGHALTLKPTGAEGTFELVIGSEDGEEGEEGDEQVEIAFEAAAAGSAECCDEAAGDGDHTVVLKLAHGDDTDMSAHHKALIGAHAGKGTEMKVQNLTPHAKQMIAVKSGGAHGVGKVSSNSPHVFVVDGKSAQSAGNGGCDASCCGDCCSKQAQVEFKAAPVKGGMPGMGAMGGMGGMRSGPPAGTPAPMRARAMRAGPMPGAPAQGALPRKMKGSANAGQDFRMLGGGGTFTWKCDGPCEVTFGPAGVQLHCQGACEITRTGDAGEWQEGAPQTGNPGLFQMLGTGASNEESNDADEAGERDDGEDDDDEGDEEEDDDDASAPKVLAAVQVF